MNDVHDEKFDNRKHRTQIDSAPSQRTKHINRRRKGNDNDPLPWTPRNFVQWAEQLVASSRCQLMRYFFFHRWHYRPRSFVVCQLMCAISDPDSSSAEPVASQAYWKGQQCRCPSSASMSRIYFVRARAFASFSRGSNQHWPQHQYVARLHFHYHLDGLWWIGNEFWPQEKNAFKKCCR